MLTLRLKGENNVAMSNAHRSESLGTPSLKDLHRLQMVLWKPFRPGIHCVKLRPQIDLRINCRL